jgi:hypothetical protein
MTEVPELWSWVPEPRIVVEQTGRASAVDPCGRSVWPGRPAVSCNSCYTCPVLWIIISIIGTAVILSAIYVALLIFFFKKLLRPRQDTTRNTTGRLARRGRT